MQLLNDQKSNNCIPYLLVVLSIKFSVIKQQPKEGRLNVREMGGGGNIPFHFPPLLS